MADEEKPAVDEESNQAADTPTSDANDIVETAEPDASAESDAQEAIDEESDQTVDTPTPDANDIVETAEPDAPAESDGQEAIETMAKNVQERAAEIEDVLANASSPGVLANAADPTLDQPESEAGATDVLPADEPNRQMRVGEDNVRASSSHPLIEEVAEQLHKSRQFTLYAVGSLCIALLGAVLFYVLMAAQLSSKVKEIDSMLGAMAKRTLQMTKGIETFSILGGQLDKTLANQLMQQEMLAANEIAVVNLNEQLGLLPEVVTTNANETMAQTQQVLLAELKALQDENAAVKTNLNRLEKILEAQKAEVSALRGVRRELSTVRASMQQVQDTVGDLYIIERARLAKQVVSPKADVVGE
jgi:hypothetical protein